MFEGGQRDRNIYIDSLTSFVDKEDCWCEVLDEQLICRHVASDKDNGRYDGRGDSGSGSGRVCKGHIAGDR